jgi:hypothetical protein
MRGKGGVKSGAEILTIGGGSEILRNTDMYLIRKVV